MEHSDTRKCPVCGAGMSYRTDSKGEPQDFRCANPSCASHKK